MATSRNHIAVFLPTPHQPRPATPPAKMATGGETENHSTEEKEPEATTNHHGSCPKLIPLLFSAER
ncbi:uncharacterized protein LACBIDRAFT_312568 [Laccaria bicolor S238N-H82]|uniref:Predicted protein n=1 Tax=Laccaria bicolor (strain S238N-H82 / ATCC MYA-4686) TaxID=486041 RepID=B0DWF1_LACBS|nr:uncharacterized protein LACBIDRAFT_312568 [Laccaria bicolor S238N-H82]EDR01076.1 predicted protein [Laccaria bicolor S238N-H82]|eukprot:XP_001888295.1 predicted protein [Laccaria bicolor S238N-H82]